MEERICERCGKEFTVLAQKSRRKYCGYRCRDNVKSCRIPGLPPLKRDRKAVQYEKIPGWKKYREEVVRLTNDQDLSVLANYDRRGFRDYHLDHKVSVWYGFKHGIPEAEIASIGNLRFIPYRENMDKGVDCYWDLFNYHLRP